MFIKIQISKSTNLPELDQLFQKKEAAKLKIEEAEASGDVNDLLEQEEDYEEAMEEIASVCAQGDGGWFLRWTTKSFKDLEIKEKACFKNIEEPPTAKLDSDGKLVTDKSSTLKLMKKG